MSKHELPGREERSSKARGRAPARFTQADIRRAIAAVESTGKMVSAVKFPPDGGFEIVVGQPELAEAINGWDVALGLVTREKPADGRR